MSALGVNVCYALENLCLTPNLLCYGGFRDVVRKLMLRNGNPHPVRYPACASSVTFRTLLHISAGFTFPEAKQLKIRKRLLKCNRLCSCIEFISHV